MRTPRNIRRTTVLAVTAVLASITLTPGLALAQLVQVEPYYAVTIQDGVPLKSGDMDGYYKVADLKEGQILRVDAEGGGWASVAYPEGLSVYVNANEVKPIESGTSLREVELTKVSALKARNEGSGFVPSWQRALPRGHEIAIGTTLRVIKKIVSEDGALLGYEVQAPKEARGYVKVAFLRTATEKEIQAFKTAKKEIRAADDQGKKTDTKTPVTDRAQAKPENTPKSQPQSQPQSKTTTPPLKPSVRHNTPKADKGTKGTKTPPEQPVDDSQQGDITEIRQGNAHPAKRGYGSLVDLARAFDQVQKQPADSAELDELAAEFRRTIAAQGDDPAGKRIREGLAGRLALLELRISARNKLRELRARRVQISSSVVEVSKLVHAFESSRGYEFVGRLVRSSVYDGKRLPLMYRVVSIAGLVPHTVGYIDPQNTDLNIASHLGKIVGILGDAHLDEVLQLRIVRPTRIDVLTAESLGLPADGQDQ